MLNISLILVLIILIIILVIAGIVLYLYIKSKDALRAYFGTTNIKEVIDKTEFENDNIPKSISSMESIYLDDIQSDFPDLNINELKRIAEKYVTYYLTKVDVNDKLIMVSEKVKKVMKNNKNIKLNDINFHETVIQKYDNKDGVYTINFNTALEYFISTGVKGNKKIQDRYRVELLYIIDYEKYEDKSESLGLNCPNCGAPVKSLKHKTCEYCGSGVVDLVKKNWILNDIVKY